MAHNCNNLRISIIIPVYGVEKYIRRCLDSVENQTYKNIEVLIVDDCGRDRSIDIAREFITSKNLEKDYKIIVNPQNLGLSGARNSGLKVASGDYIYFLDSDDYLPSDCMETLVMSLREFPYDIVIGGYSEVNEENDSHTLVSIQEIKLFENTSILEHYRHGFLYVMAWNKLYRRNFLNENALFFDQGILHEDVIWSFKVFSIVSSISCINKTTYNYVLRENSIMSGMSIYTDIHNYTLAFYNIKKFISNNSIILKSQQYHVIEGKKSGILNSLLEIGEIGIFNKYYPIWHAQPLISPFKAYRKGLITLPYLIRDFHYLLPCSVGKCYKRLFYRLFYKWRGKNIEGNQWKKIN